jgi:fumarate reductase flavoprotein subunit
MIKKYTPYEWSKDIFSMRIPGMVGEGIRMAWEVGAGAEGMNMELISMAGSDTRAMLGQILNSAAMNETMFSPATPTFNQPNLMVNLQGERFMNEEEMGNATFMANAVARQKNRVAFVIYDSAIAKLYEETGLDWPSAMHSTVRVPNIDTEVKKAVGSGNVGMFVAGTLEELASKTGINAAGLKRTVEEYNKVCKTGRDETFHKRPLYLRPIRQPNFYAGKAVPGAYGSLGGIKINHRTEVVTKDQDVIPGLYAAGVDANSVYADSYVFILPGNTMGFALNSGRMAGENAADFVNSNQ